MALNTSLRVAATVVAVFALAGCASAPVPTASPTIGSPDPRPTVSDVPADPSAAFREIADASCDRANAEGVVETTADGAASNILVPKANAYQDFNAVAVSEDDGWSLIWSTEEFTVCNASVGYSMSEESGGDYALVVTFNQSDGTFSTVYDGGEGYVFESSYAVDGGVFTQATLGPADNPLVMNITYGMPTDEQIAVLHSAVDAFLAEE